MKRILIISSIILFAAISAHSQTRNNPIPGTVEKVLKFYPNPATSNITFDFIRNHEKGLNLQVFNFLGKPVFESPNVATKTIIIYPISTVEYTSTNFVTSAAKS